MTRPDRPTALVVDDDRPIRDVCRRALEGLGLEVATAADSQRALDMLRASRFDLVLADIDMGSPDAGVALAEEVRSRWPETDVVMMTGKPCLETAVPSLRSKAADYLAKPFSMEQLEAVATRLIGLRRLSGELETERSLRRELQAAYAELRKVERVKAAILARTNHELRTPVTVAQLALELLEDEGLGAHAKELCGRLGDGLKRLHEVVEELLLYARTRHSDLSVDEKDVDPGEVAAEVVRLHAPLCDERRVEVRVRSEGKPCAVRADAGLLRTAFSHLLVNAVRFNRPGGNVLVSTEYSPDGVRVSFSDTGIGMGPGEEGEAFDGFYQAAESLTREVGGLGLGLAIVRRVAEAHGGDVTVQSRPGEGSIFRFRLPRRSAPPV